MSSRAGKRDSDSSESTLSDSTSWIRWYCELRGNEFFCEIDEEFVQDDFNLTGLATMVPNYEYALDVILDVENGTHAVLLTGLRGTRHQRKKKKKKKKKAFVTDKFGVARRR
jgi:hypothetical protein